MPMMTLVMAMCECQLFYIFTKKVQQYGAQNIIAVGLFLFITFYGPLTKRLCVHIICMDINHPRFF